MSGSPGDTPHILATKLREIADAVDAGSPSGMPLLLVGEACGLHYLVTIWEDGHATLATRMTPADTWSRPFPLAVA